MSKKLLKQRDLLLREKQHLLERLELMRDHLVSTESALRDAHDQSKMIRDWKAAYPWYKRVWQAMTGELRLES